MLPTEKVERDFPQYHFVFIYLPDDCRGFHGQIRGRIIYINRNDDIEVQVFTMLHEVIHAQFDTGQNLLDRKAIKTGRAEYFANKWAKRDSEKYFI
ncbi:ImmA/IrrE family metallo-endopeptidase [Oenococcus sicerae]|uniref:ImmA/IrrE family metallo-endopeptidase n=1 Tax=Oenococcus sicerae TaxID=2203724 RepID=A0AAJ1R7N8_9LACO|nr:ImmA/IrrE family metallo-endopeptidase [Oenococcus sicerae]MDN6899538.1 ImmA/IrrE family metallo-endopeptidase [Oenococcus sicerae]